MDGVLVLGNIGVFLEILKASSKKLLLVLGIVKGLSKYWYWVFLRPLQKIAFGIEYCKSLRGHVEITLTLRGGGGCLKSQPMLPREGGARPCERFQGVLRFNVEKLYQNLLSRGQFCSFLSCIAEGNY